LQPNESKLFNETFFGGEKQETQRAKKGATTKSFLTQKSSDVPADCKKMLTHSRDVFTGARVTG
jgi:hypothetical protein